MRILSRLVLAASLLLTPIAALAQGTPLTSYPAASALTGTEKLLGDQNGTKTFAPSLLMNYTIANGAVASTTAKGLLPQLPGTTTTFLRGDGSFAAPPTGTGGGTVQTMHPGYRSGNWYNAGRYGTAALQVTANTLMAFPLIVDNDVTISALGANVTTSVGSTSVAVAVYANSTSFRPGAKLFEGSTSISTATSGGASTALASNQTLTRGVYWIVVVASSGGPSMTCVSSTDPVLRALVGGDAASTTFTTPSGTLTGGAFTSGTAFPSDLSSTNFANGFVNVPMIAFKTI